MSGHVHDRLALAAAGALGDADEAARVDEHARGCAECAADRAAWDALADGLRHLPAPRPSAALVARTRAAVEGQLAAHAERAWNRAALGFAVAFAWTVAVGAWLLADLLRGELALRLGTSSVGPTAAWYAAYVMTGWLAAGASAVLLGRRASEEGRAA